MSANGISHLPSKQARQAAKLALAQTERQAGGNTSAVAYRVDNQLDASELPSLYSGNVSVANSHPDGLVLGRPWKS